VAKTVKPPKIESIEIMYKNLVATSRRTLFVSKLMLLREINVALNGAVFKNENFVFNP
jgi:hypothetical protein